MVPIEGGGLLQVWARPGYLQPPVTVSSHDQHWTRVVWGSILATTPGFLQCRGFEPKRSPPVTSTGPSLYPLGHHSPFNHYNYPPRYDMQKPVLPLVALPKSQAEELSTQ